MRTTVMMLILLASSINLAACSSITGNVVPEKGPTMEQVYDSMETDENTAPDTTVRTNLPVQATNNTFHRLPNPELSMYVFPHLAGKDEVPIPGYNTVFNAYNRDHYALPSETL